MDSSHGRRGGAGCGPQQHHPLQQLPLQQLGHGGPAPAPCLPTPLQRSPTSRNECAPPHPRRSRRGFCREPAAAAPPPFTSFSPCCTPLCVSSHAFLWTSPSPFALHPASLFSDLPPPLLCMLPFLCGSASLFADLPLPWHTGLSLRTHALSSPFAQMPLPSQICLSLAFCRSVTPSPFAGHSAALNTNARNLPDRLPDPPPAPPTLTRRGARAHSRAEKSPCPVFYTACGFQF